MERLAREIGVTSGALFRHFPTRAAMLEEAARRAVDLLEQTFPPHDLPPLERLRRFVAARAAVSSQHGGLPQLVFSEQFGKALPIRGARAVRAVVKRSWDFLVETLREAAQRGAVRKDLPPEDLALAVLGMLLARALLASLVEDGGPSVLADPTEVWERILAQLGPIGSGHDSPL